MIEENQLPQSLRDIIDEEVATFEEGTSIQRVNEIPQEFPIQNKRLWLRVEDVICVFIDMKDSTKLSAVEHERTTASAYQIFTGTAVRLLNALGATYIDVRGDGAFGLFNKGQEYRAFVAAVTFKTFAREVCLPKIKGSTGLDIGCHIGVDQRTVLVRRLGLRDAPDRSPRSNEVWAGKPVNMAAKLASLTLENEILVSDRFYEKLTDARARMSCGCENGQPGTNKVPLWTPRDLSNDSKFDFSAAYELKSLWCQRHGKEYCEALLALSK